MECPRRVHREFFPDHPEKFDFREPGKIFVKEYADFIAHKNEKLGRPGNWMQSGRASESNTTQTRPPERQSTDSAAVILTLTSTAFLDSQRCARNGKKRKFASLKMTDGGRHSFVHCDGLRPPLQQRA
jgi:hypothetical protein